MSISVAFLEKRCERLFDKADTLKDELDQMNVWSPEDLDTQKKLRQMNLLYREASTISICLSAFDRERKTAQEG